MIDDQFVASIIRILHIAIISYVVIAPFVIGDSWKARTIYFWVVTSIIVHWYTNNKTCLLTYIENKLRNNTSDSQSFIYNIIAPIYDLSLVIDKCQIRVVTRMIVITLWSYNFYRMLLLIPKNATLGDVFQLFLLVKNK